jgi:hypothetical protein
MLPIGPHVRHFNDGNQCIQREKNKSWTWRPIMPKQRERCHSFFIAAVVLNQCFGDLGKLPTLLVLPQIPCEQQLLIELAINSGDFW